MHPGSSGVLLYLSLGLSIGGVATASDDPTQAKGAPPRAPAPSNPPAKRPASASATTTATGPTEASQARLYAEARLKELAQVVEKDQTPAQRALKAAFEERLQKLDEWDKASKARIAAENPRPTPEEEAARRKDDLERARSLAEQSARSPEVLLPEVFRLPPDQVDESRLAEMREVIESAKLAHKDRTDQSEKQRAEPAVRAKLLNGLRLERDRLHARTTTLPALRLEREAAYASARDEESRRLARERLVNFQWEAAAESEKLRAAEASLALEVRRGASVEIELQTLEVFVAVTKARVAALGDRYQVVAERYKAALSAKAATEERKAASAGDPVEKFVARRKAELLGLEAQITEDQKALAASPEISLDEETELANRAEADFEGLKAEVKENRIGGLLALRLNNDFRRISRERALLLRHELPRSNALTTYYENALTEAELSYFGDARDDRFERETFLETLPTSRHLEANAALDGLDARHKKLLGERRRLLDELLKRAEATHNQVNRRLAILDKHYAFVRTNIFWVRDSEPIGPETPAMARRDAWRVASALVRLAAEPLDRSRWTPVSAEFGFGAAGVAGFPWLIRRARRTLKGLMA